MPLNASASTRVLHEAGETLQPHGSEWIIDAEGCAPGPLASLSAMQRVCDAVIERARLHVVGRPVWHQFDEPGGVTGLYLLSESHLACHTFPEYGLAAFNLYCCRRRQPCDWESLLQEHLFATRVTVREIVRGPGGGGSS
jgi:S-adenosylmethionine decarboxylase